MRRLALAAALALLPLHAFATDAAVTIDNFTFSPPALTVHPGTRVIWTNRDDIPHTVTSADDPRVMKSAPLDTDESFAFTFTHPGKYHYFCSLHPHMEGSVTVQ
jgi:plastocyanin